MRNGNFFSSRDGYTIMPDAAQQSGRELAVPAAPQACGGAMVRGEGPIVSRRPSAAAIYSGSYPTSFLATDCNSEETEEYRCARAASVAFSTPTRIEELDVSEMGTIAHLWAELEGLSWLGTYNSDPVQSTVVGTDLRLTVPTSWSGLIIAGVWITLTFRLLQAQEEDPTLTSYNFTSLGGQFIDRQMRFKWTAPATCHIYLPFVARFQSTALPKLANIGIGPAEYIEFTGLTAADVVAGNINAKMLPLTAGSQQLVEYARLMGIRDAIPMGYPQRGYAGYKD